MAYDRQVPVPYRRSGRALATRTGRPLPHVYLDGARKLRGKTAAAPADHLHGSRLKWLISSLLVASVGAIAITSVLLGSLDPTVRQGHSWVEDLEKASQDVFVPSTIPQRQAAASISGQKMDKLMLTPDGLITKHIIQDHVRQQLGTREKITIKSYARVVALLATAPPQSGEPIPPFNPFDLYANTKTPGAGPAADDSDQIATRVLDLVGGILPNEDGQSLTDDQVQQIVALAADEVPLDDVAGDAPDSEGGAGSEPGAALPELSEITDATSEAQPTFRAGNDHTAVIVKNVFDSDTAPKVEGQEVRAVSTKAGDTLTDILKSNGASPAVARQIVTAAKTILDTDILLDGQEVRLTLVPVSPGATQLTFASVTLFSAGQGHLLTVARSDSGDYFASDTPVAATMLAAQTGSSRRATLYTSLYTAANTQGMSPDMIQRVLRTFAYDVDFQRRVGPGDTFEAFFDLPDDSTGGATGDILFCSLTVGGETRKFYRFRTPDGLVDFFDEQGNNAKKFLNRKPIRGADIRFTSGFGMRMHPLLKQRRMHTGVDWSAATGTPILAAGSGTIEEFHRKGGNGNYVRIRHANGYETAYSHMSRFADLSVGMKVNQGDVIGYVGTTGLSSGPHLHFEVLVNNKYVDPMTIQVPRERQLTGKLLSDFQKERLRIEEMMARSPVSSQVAATTKDSGG